MPNRDYQRHTFLGGEVSPSLYERVDMDKFSKWFSKAENIRFFETGGFKNRPGFVKVADTKYNTAGQIIKLLAFQFNDEESFLIEMGTGYIRFYRNGRPIMNGDVPYELNSPISSFTADDLKYAQSGDIIFIAHPIQGIYELVRLNVEGSNWEIKKFNTNIFPMKEENADVDFTLSSAVYSLNNTKQISIANPSAQYYENVVLTINGTEHEPSLQSMTKDELLNFFTESFGADYQVMGDGDKIIVANIDPLSTVPDFSLTFGSEYTETVTISQYQFCDDDWPEQTVYISYADFKSLSTVRVFGESHNTIRYDQTKDIAADSVSQSAESAVGFGAFEVRNVQGYFTIMYSRGIFNDAANSRLGINFQCRSYGGSITIYISGERIITPSYSYSSEPASSATASYTITSSKDFFNKFDVGDCVLVKNLQDSQQLNGSYNTAGTYTLGPIKSDGNWRFYTLGNWVGNITIQYSTDNKQTWVDYYKWASQDANDTPANINTSGTLTTDDLVWFRVVSTVTSTGTKPLQVFFAANSFSVNSYYKVLYKNSNTSAIVECIKNDVGEFTNNYRWRLPAFSNMEGWPQTIAFYQNRLFFGKDYIVYGSRSNDFWDFYEPVELKDDDPVVMSLLSQKVNTIRNLVTQRSFFAFTAGNEAGIGSEGALTQTDKYLKPFSSNGSSFCNPVLISDVVLFVDKSFNSVRALKYSLEADGYEAPDITLTLKYLLRNERIISTDIIYEEKEALFLSDTGTIWVLKYITDQNVLSWSHLKHAFGKITNICVVPNGAKHDLYIVVEANNRKWIERMDSNEYMDTVEYFQQATESTIPVTGSAEGDVRVIIQGNKTYKRTVSAAGTIQAPDDASSPFKVGAAYTSTATLLSPTIQETDHSFTTYHKKAPYKVWFYYTDSYGFKVGVEEGEKMPIEWQKPDEVIDNEVQLTSGKKSVLIPSRFDGSARISFVQSEPYPMEIQDALIETDFGGK